MSDREGVLWREIPARPGERPRHVYVVNGKAAAFAGEVTVTGELPASFNTGLMLAKPYWYTVGDRTTLATTLEEAKRLAEEAVWTK